MVVLAPLHAEHDDSLGEEGLALAKVALSVKGQPPARRAAGLAQDASQAAGAAISGNPVLDAAVGVGGGGKGLRGDGAAVEGTLEADGDALGWAAGGGVEHVAGDVVLGLRHDVLCVCVCLLYVKRKGKKKKKKKVKRCEMRK